MRCSNKFARVSALMSGWPSAIIAGCTVYLQTLWRGVHYTSHGVASCTPVTVWRGLICAAVTQCRTYIGWRVVGSRNRYCHHDRQLLFCLVLIRLSC
jgi:hypothetical protein